MYAKRHGVIHCYYLSSRKFYLPHARESAGDRIYFWALEYFACLELFFLT